MSEETLNKQEHPEQLSDILLVMDKDKKKIQAVTGIGKNGELETIDPNKKNQSEFMRVDKNGDVFSNFFSNFLRQIKNPTNFSFFKVPDLEAIKTAKEMQKQVDSPSEAGEALMAKHEVKEPKEQQQENKNNMETTQPAPEAPETKEYRFKPEELDWETFNNLGLSKEKLEKLGVLDTLLKGYKTSKLIPISLNLGTAVTRMDARLALQRDSNGAAVLGIHGIRKEPNLNFAFFGHEFTKEDKANLLNTGNMGRTVNLTNPKTGEAIPSIISVDRLTNELIALRTDKIKIPDEIKGVKLDESQKQTLVDGKPLYLEGMISKKGEPFNANVQYNADKHFVEYLFDNTKGQKQTKSQQENSKQQSQQTATPRTFRGKELDEAQHQKFKEGQTVYVSGLTDKKGKEYNGYITYNKETNKTDFSFQNPNKLKEQAKPIESHKTQNAVNSEGKTNETTKNIQEPLKSGQTNPDTKKQQNQQNKQEKPKAKGRKM